MTPAALADMAPGPFAFGAMALRHGPHEATMRRTLANYLHGGGACREAAAAQTRWVTRLLDVALYSAARSHFAPALVHARREQVTFYRSENPGALPDNPAAAALAARTAATDRRTLARLRRRPGR
jgi:hypothetical protein